MRTLAPSIVLGVPGFTREERPVLFWGQVVITGIIALFFGYVGFGLIVSGLSMS